MNGVDICLPWTSAFVEGLYQRDAGPTCPSAYEDLKSCFLLSALTPSQRRAGGKQNASRVGRTTVLEGKTCTLISKALETSSNFIENNDGAGRPRTKQSEVVALRNLQTLRVMNGLIVTWWRTVDSLDLDDAQLPRELVPKASFCTLSFLSSS